jgi:hypothetical protein
MRESFAAPAMTAETTARAELGFSVRSEQQQKTQTQSKAITTTKAKAKAAARGATQG